VVRPASTAQDRHLYSIADVKGYHLHATDGEIGHVDDFLFDEATWRISYLVVDTSSWVGGRSVLVSSAVVTAIDWPEAKIHVSLTRDAIKNSPSVETADVNPAENAPTLWIM
jgi:hypothetical protein